MMPAKRTRRAMSSGSSLPYHLRPNKAVDRELFLGLLSRLAATLHIENHRYVGLGGPFLEDFRLVHARLGIDDLVCVEDELEVHKRQKFNRPVNRIRCVHNTLENYIDSNDFKMPVIIWFDYTDPSNLKSQIERFSRTVGDVPLNSVMRITLNANPTSLGKPGPGVKKTTQEWRLTRLRACLGRFVPSDLKPDGMTYRNFGRSLLKTLQIAVDKEMLSHMERRIVWALATHYADGQPMATATIIVCSEDYPSIDTLVNGWKYSSKPDAPLLLDMPALSTLERLTMESCKNPRKRMGYDLPQSDMKEDPFESFKRFYRVFPHFSRVEM